MNDRIRIVLVGRHEVFGLQASWLENQGHSVLRAPGLEAAQTLCEQGSGDVVACELASEDVADVLRRRSPTCAVPVLIVSGGGFADGARVSAALEGGAADYLHAPFSAEEFERRCRLAYRYGLIVRENRRLRGGTEGAAVPAAGGSEGAVRREAGGEISSLAAVERQHILDVLRSQRGNKARTAVVLGIHRRKLYRLLERLQISPAER